jgi:YHS domain-containing protein
MNKLFVKSRTVLSLLKIFAPAVLLTMLACGQQPKHDAAVRTNGYEQADSTKPVFTKDMVDNLKDPACGMPLTAGSIVDTLHYGGKVYGFCSDECRDEFKANPEALAKQAVMKQ